MYDDDDDDDDDGDGDGDGDYAIPRFEISFSSDKKMYIQEMVVMLLAYNPVIPIDAPFKFLLKTA